MGTEREISPATLEIRCDSWDEFKSRVQRDYSEDFSGLTPLYRGHARTEWMLDSPWDRRAQLWPSPKTPPGHEGRKRLLKKVLQDFKEHAIGLPGIKSRELADLDWWAIGRHYGLVTPLLDWSRSPYVAAFFALTGYAEKLSPGLTTLGTIDPKRFLAEALEESVAVWSFLPEEDQWETRGPRSELSILNPQIDIGHRQRAQRGLFTQLDHEEYLDLDAYLASFEVEKHPLRKYLIPCRDLASALMELRMMNITFATLFPDLSGAALQANYESVAFTLTILARARG